MEAFHLTDGGSAFNVLLNLNVDNAERAWNDYQEAQTKKQPPTKDCCFGLCIGDEFTHFGETGVITGMNNTEVWILWSDGSVGQRPRELMRYACPTGRHYDDLYNILTALQKGPDNA